MSHQLEELLVRVGHLEDELAALEREVENLRQELRSFAHLVDRGDVAAAETAL